MALLDWSSLESGEAVGPLPLMAGVGSLEVDGGTVAKRAHVANEAWRRHVRSSAIPLSTYADEKRVDSKFPQFPLLELLFKN